MKTVANFMAVACMIAATVCLMVDNIEYAQIGISTATLLTVLVLSAKDR